MEMMMMMLLPALFTIAQSFTIEQAMSAPFSSELIAKGNSAAWVQYEQGRRNIYALRGGKPVKLTNYTADDGQEIGQMSFTPDVKSIVYTRGGDLEMGREIPNPGSLLDRPGQAVWKVNVDDAQDPVKVADGHSPVVSSKGEIAYIRGGDVYKDGKKWFTTRGAGQLAWSPDGSRIAFVSNRGTHALIGVTSGDRIQYLDPSVDRDAAPAWSPDGSKVAFIRNAAFTRAFMFGPIRSADPWSIVSVDLTSGKAATLFRSDPGPGSAYSAITSESQLHFAADGSVVFAWEKSGWRLLYAVRAGDKPRLLTPGAFEVEHVSMDDARKWMYFSGNKNDIDRRHAWRVEVANGRLEALTSGSGNEWSPEPLENGSVAMLASNHQTPSHFALKPASSAAMLQHVGASFVEGFPKLAEPKQVIYQAADGLSIHAQVFMPPATFTGKRPAAIFIHGGSRRQMLLGFHYKSYYSNAYALNQYLASIGYIVLAINYRSGVGYGLNFREAENYGATGASEFQDVLGAGLYLRSRNDVDPARIGLWGGSYGGYLTAMGLSRASDLFAAGVDIHGVHDWNNVIRNFVPAYNPQSQSDAAKLAYDSSPMSSIKGWRSPVLLIHGDDDRNVPFGETVRLAEALRKQGVQFEQLIFPDDVHDFLTHDHFLKAYRATAEFLNRHLMR